MVGAVVALLHLHGLGADGERQHLVAEADAEHRRPLSTSFADHRHGIFAGRGRDRPGRSTGTRRRACSARMSSAGVVAGTTVTAQPASASSRRMLRFTP